MNYSQEKTRERKQNPKTKSNAIETSEKQVKNRIDPNSSCQRVIDQVDHQNRLHVCSNLSVDVLMFEMSSPG